MTDDRSERRRLYLTALVLLAYACDLAWQHFHGGVVSHHILHRADLPAISNWWGLLLLPALTWFLTARIQRRLGRSAVAIGFFGALLLGILLAISFTYHLDALSSYTFLGMIVLAVLLPVYRAECVLGFVLGMTFTFGGILPTAFASIIAALSAIIHRLLLPPLVRFWKFLKTPRRAQVRPGVSISIGIFFGNYPAFKAAKLDPIEALRYDQRDRLSRFSCYCCSVSWLSFSEEGYSRDELLKLFALTRDQRNQHRTALFSVLQFYSTLVAGLFAAEVTLCTFAIPYILSNVKQPNERAALFFLLSLVPIAILFLVSFALVNARKEYEKLIEHLTVEQKLETALGMMGSIAIQSQPAGLAPYPADMALLYQRWIDGRMGFDTSADFVASTVARTQGGFFAPLRRSLLVIGTTDAVLLFAIVIWGVLLLVQRGVSTSLLLAALSVMWLAYFGSLEIPRTKPPLPVSLSHQELVDRREIVQRRIRGARWRWPFNGQSRGHSSGSSIGSKEGVALSRSNPTSSASHDTRTKRSLPLRQWSQIQEMPSSQR